MENVQLGKCYLIAMTRGETPARIEKIHTDGSLSARSLRTSHLFQISDLSKVIRLCDANEIEACGNDNNRRNRSHTTTLAQSVRLVPVHHVAVKREVKALEVVIPPVVSNEKRKPFGILNAAYEILATSDKAMTTREIVSEAIRIGLWHGEGKTPHATLHAALSRDIKAYGKDSRFIKGARGKFAAR